MHALGEYFDTTELRRARASSKTIDLRTLEFGPDQSRSPSTTSKRVTHLHIPVPAITRGTVARPHELERKATSQQLSKVYSTVNLFDRLKASTYMIRVYVCLLLQR